MILIVDTNEIISALIKDSFSRKILLHPKFSFYTPDFTLDEIEKHLSLITRKSALPRRNVVLLLNTLLEKIEIVEFNKYKHKYNEAQNIINKIDPDDVPFIALALSLPNDGIWSNDKHFLKQKIIKVWTTEDLIKLI